MNRLQRRDVYRLYKYGSQRNRNVFSAVLKALIVSILTYLLTYLLTHPMTITSESCQPEEFWIVVRADDVLNEFHDDVSLKCVRRLTSNDRHNNAVYQRTWVCFSKQHQCGRKKTRCGLLQGLQLNRDRIYARIYITVHVVAWCSG